MTHPPLALPVLILPSKQAMHYLSEPEGNLHPNPPKQCKDDPDPDQVVDDIGAGKDLLEENQCDKEREVEKGDPEN